MRQRSDWLTPGRTTLLVVFDTNVYRGLNDGELDRIRAAEVAAGVLALGTVWSCLETLSHLGAESPQARARALATLRRIWRHVGYKAEEGPRLRLHEAGEVALVRGLFGQTPDEPLLELAFVGDQVVSAITQRPGGPSQGDHLSSIRRRVEAEERQFESLTVERPPAPGAAKEALGAEGYHVPRLIVAAGLIQALAEKYSVALTDVDAGGAATRVSRAFPVAMQFLCDLIADAGSSGVTPGGGNSAWDLKLAFHAGSGAAIAGVPVLLVTGDRRLLRAAQRAGHAQRVVRLEQYQALLVDPGRVSAYASELTR